MSEPRAPDAFHPIQTQRVRPEIPAAVALRAYEVYRHVFGEQQAMIDPARGYRGGFGVGEIIAFLYARSFPKEEWRARVDEALEHREGLR